jgi:cytochrome c55X
MAAGLLSLPLIALAADPSPERQAALTELLHEDCGSCHGMTLRGGLGPSLLPEALPGKPDEALVDTILNGHPGTAMPPWKSLLTRDEAAWLVRRLRSGAHYQPPPVAP